jgi:hypothetical protein
LVSEENAFFLDTRSVVDDRFNWMIPNYSRYENEEVLIDLFIVGGQGKE